jgi:hypothetical protein
VRRLIPLSRPPDPVGTFRAVARYTGRAVILPVRPHTQRIRRGGSTSRSTVMGCGVPQGSVLSPDLVPSIYTWLIHCP